MKMGKIRTAVYVWTGVTTLLLGACSSDKNTMQQSQVTIEEDQGFTETVSLETESILNSSVETKEIISETESQTIETETDSYAEIDMESTLSGVEWIKTFEGIITEPKLVVFNDDTNKKIILEQSQEVEFSDDDTLAVYIPKNSGEVTRYLLFEDASNVDGITLLRNISSSIMREGYVVPMCINITFNGENMILVTHLKLIG